MESTDTEMHGPLEPATSRETPRWGRVILAVVTVVALLAVSSTAVTAATGKWRFGQHATGDQQFGRMTPGNGQGQRGMPGLEGVVTAIDTSAKKITLAGAPGVTTVTVDASVALTALQADGTTKPAMLGDFAVGRVVRVHGKIDRSKIQPGQRPNPADITVMVTEITLVPNGDVRGFGLVTAVNGGALTVSGMGNLTVVVTPASGATIKKMDGTAVAVGDIKVGDRVSFHGTQQGGNAVSASDLRVMAPGAFGRGGFGPGAGDPGFGPGGGFGPHGPGPGMPKPPAPPPA